MYIGCIGKDLLFPGFRDFIGKIPEKVGQRRGIVVDRMLGHVRRGRPGSSEGFHEFIIDEEVSEFRSVVFQKGKRAVRQEIFSSCCIIVLRHFSCFRDPVLFFDAFYDVIVGHWFSEVVALDFFASDALQEIELFFRLDAFSEYLHADFFGHADGAFDDALRFFGEVRQEFHIDLQFIEAVVLEDIQRGIAAAEVVHPDLEACFMEIVDFFADLAEVMDEDAFSDFHIQHVVRDAVLVGDAVQFLEHFAGEEVDAGKVEGNGHNRFSAVDAFPVVLADMLDHVHIELADLTAVFESRDEDAGRNEALLRIFPAGQCLQAAERAGKGTHDRLVVDLDISVLQCFVDMVDSVISELGQVPDFIGIFEDMDIEAVADAVAGKLGQIAGKFRIDIEIGDMVHAEFRIEAYAASEAHKLLIDLAGPQLQIHIIGQDDEMVVSKTRDVIMREYFLQYIRHITQQLVAFLAAVLHVEHFEILDIEIEDCRLGRFCIEAAVLEFIARMSQESLLPGESRQRINVPRQILDTRVHDKGAENISFAGQFHPASEVFHVHNFPRDGSHSVIHVIMEVLAGTHLFVDLAFHAAYIIDIHKMTE